MGNPFELYSLKSNKNQSLTTISVMGQSQKIVVNQSSGFMEVMGQKMEITDAELEEAIASAALFTETNLDYSTIELVGKTQVNDEAAYEIKISDSKSLFYSIETGLKLKEVTTQEVEGNRTGNLYTNASYSIGNYVEHQRPIGSLYKILRLEYASNVTTLTLESSTIAGTFAAQEYIIIKGMSTSSANHKNFSVISNRKSIKQLI